MKALLKNNYKKIIIAIVLLIIATISMFIISSYATNPESYKTTIGSINDKKSTVTEITAATTITSTLLAALPGDATTPLSNQILEISSYLVIVVCALMLEKSLLTVMGYLSFKILIPVSCLLLGINTFIKKGFLKAIAIKLTILAIVLVSAIPISLKISDMICETNSASIQQAAESVNEIVPDEANSENKSWSDGIINKFKSSISNAGDFAKQKLNNLIDAVAVFIIAYCAIPIIIFILIFKFIKFLFKLKLPTDVEKLKE